MYIKVSKTPFSITLQTFNYTETERPTLLFTQILISKIVGAVYFKKNLNGSFEVFDVNILAYWLTRNECI